MTGKTYVELDRKAVRIGDYIHINKYNSDDVSTIAKVIDIPSRKHFYADYVGGDELKEYSGRLLVHPGPHDEFSVLEEKQAEAETGAGIHRMKDEELGGVEREYKKVSRQAEEGDLILVVSYEGDDVSQPGDVLTVDEVTISAICVKESDALLDRTGTYNDDYVVLEPTDVVIVDGKRYKTVVRHAEEGEKLLVVSYEGREASSGEVVIAEGVTEDGSIVFGNFRGLLDNSGCFNDKYLVLEPTEEGEGSPLDEIKDLLSSIAVEVSRLEAQVAELEGEAEPTAAKFQAGDYVVNHIGTVGRIDSVGELTDGSWYFFGEWADNILMYCREDILQRHATPREILEFKSEVEK